MFYLHLKVTHHLSILYLNHIRCTYFKITSLLSILYLNLIFKLQVIIGAVQIVMSLISASIVKAVGKRKLIISCLLATAGCCVCISTYAGTYIPSTVHSYDPDTFVDQKEIVPVILFLLLVCFYGLGLPWVLLSEVFPFR